MNPTQQPRPANQAPRQQMPQMPVETRRPKPGPNGSSKWHFGFWDCCSPMRTGCLGFWCPCLLFGQTHAREHNKGETSGCGLMVGHPDEKSPPSTGPDGAVVLRMVLCRPIWLPLLLAMRLQRAAEEEIRNRRQCVWRLLRGPVLPMLWIK